MSSPVETVLEELSNEECHRLHVIVQGSTYKITRAIDRRSEELRALPVQPFAPGDKAHCIEIQADTDSGRRRRPSRVADAGEPVDGQRLDD